jgi:hypothetical protein
MSPVEMELVVNVSEMVYTSIIRGDDYGTCSVGSESNSMYKYLYNQWRVSCMLIASRPDDEDGHQNVR